jgi:DNA-binding NarL/FixJ family response regulator
MAASILLDRRPGPPPRPVTAGLAVLVRAGDPGLTARLAGLPGIRLVEEPADAAVIITDLPAAEADGPPTLVMAQGAAAVAALRAGARAVLPPDACPALLAAALPAVARGLAVLPPGVLGSLTGRDPAAPIEAGLTRREREVLDLLAAGASNKVIARRLGLSFHTAKAHVAAVLQKLGAGSRADAVARGARAGLVLL